MMKLNKKQSGFTIIELLIVLITIGILAAIVVSTYSGIEAKNRNSTRRKDIAAIQTQLEAYYSQNGHYPSLTDINSASWRGNNMRNFQVNIMLDPSSKQTVTTVQLAASPGPKVYSYQVTDSNGNACESDDTNCAKYTLTAAYEGTVDGDSTYVKQNLD